MREQEGRWFNPEDSMVRDPTPEERTADLLSQNYDVLAQNLQDRIVVLAGTEKQIVLTGLEAWPREKVGKRWHAVRELEPGDWWAFLLKIGGRKPIRQSLITAKDEGQNGAIVRVTRVSRFNPEENAFVPMPREGDIADFLGLEGNQVAKLRFLDDSDILYLVPQGQEMSDLKPTKAGGVDPDQANRALERFLEE